MSDETVAPGKRYRRRAWLPPWARGPWRRDVLLLLVGGGLVIGAPALTGGELSPASWKLWVVARIAAQLFGVLLLGYLLARRGGPRLVVALLVAVAAPLVTLPAWLDLALGAAVIEGWTPTAFEGDERVCVEDDHGLLHCWGAPAALGASDCTARRSRLVWLPHLDRLLAWSCGEQEESRSYGAWSVMWREGATALAGARALSEDARREWAEASVRADAQTLYGILDALESRDRFYLAALEQVARREDWLSVIAANRLWERFPDEAPAISRRVLAAGPTGARTTLQRYLEGQPRAAPSAPAP